MKTNVLVLPKQCNQTATSLTLEGITKEEWKEVGKNIGSASRGMQWFVGDWINYGSHAWGEMYDEAVKVTGFQKSYLQNISSVCRAIPFSQRCEELTFAHYIEIAKAEPQHRESFAAMALEHALSTREIKFSVQENRLVRIKEIQEASGRNSGILNIQGAIARVTLWTKTVFEKESATWKEKERKALRETVKPLREVLKKIDDYLDETT